jgi:ABC-type nitrate/sulfonate/bicarbonate transport system permease component
VTPRATTAAAWAVLLVTWELASRVAGSVSFPAPTEIVADMVADGWSFYGPNLATTAREAAGGLLWGGTAAVACAVVAVAVPRLDGPVTRLGVTVACVPLLAVGPVIQIVAGGEAAKVVLAAMSCTLPVLVATVAGLRSAGSEVTDVVRAAGGGVWAELRLVRARAGAAGVLTGLRIGVPSAVLGAMVGEYLGGERGLGVAMVVSQQQLLVTRTWGLAVAAAALAGFGWAVVATVERRVDHWRQDR